eukprot:140047-Pyramimonas_sp.AAC.1
MNSPRSSLRQDALGMLRSQQMAERTLGKIGGNFIGLVYQFYSYASILAYVAAVGEVVSMLLKGAVTSAQGQVRLSLPARQCSTYPLCTATRVRDIDAPHSGRTTCMRGSHALVCIPGSIPVYHASIITSISYLKPISNLFETVIYIPQIATVFTIWAVTLVMGKKGIEN